MTWLRVLLQELDVDSLWLRGQRLHSPVGDLEVAPFRGFEQPGLLHVGPCPTDPVVEGGLPAAGQQLLALFVGQMELIGKRLYCPSHRMFLPVCGIAEQREHHTLIVGYSHRTPWLILYL
jgi:hypothetical protein